MMHRNIRRLSAGSTGLCLTGWLWRAGRKRLPDDSIWIKDIPHIHAGVTHLWYTCRSLWLFLTLLLARYNPEDASHLRRRLTEPPSEPTHFAFSAFLEHLHRRHEKLLTVWKSETTSWVRHIYSTIIHFSSAKSKTHTVCAARCRSPSSASVVSKSPHSLDLEWSDVLGMSRIKDWTIPTPKPRSCRISIVHTLYSKTVILKQPRISMEFRTASTLTLVDIFKLFLQFLGNLKLSGNMWVQYDQCGSSLTSLPASTPRLLCRQSAARSCTQPAGRPSPSHSAPSWLLWSGSCLIE